jgi:hypothetical protein
MNKFDKFYNEHINEDIESDLYAHKDRYNKGLEPEPDEFATEKFANELIEFVQDISGQLVNQIEDLADSRDELGSLLVDVLKSIYRVRDHLQQKRYP